MWAKLFGIYTLTIFWGEFFRNFKHFLNHPDRIWCQMFSNITWFSREWSLLGVKMYLRRISKILLMTKYIRELQINPYYVNHKFRTQFFRLLKSLRIVCQFKELYSNTHAVNQIKFRAMLFGWYTINIIFFIAPSIIKILIKFLGYWNFFAHTNHIIF